jgi:hypothetical protein
MRSSREPPSRMVDVEVSEGMSVSYEFWHIPTGRMIRDSSHGTIGLSQQGKTISTAVAQCRILSMPDTMGAMTGDVTSATVMMTGDHQSRLGMACDGPSETDPYQAHTFGVVRSLRRLKIPEMDTECAAAVFSWIS